MNYDESMAGLDQIFQALFNQQQQPTRTEVDEMQQGQQAQADNFQTMFGVPAIGQNQQPSGIDLMNENFNQGG